MKNRGFGILEIVISVGIISVAIFALLGTTASFLKLARDTTHKVQANNLMHEGLEAVRVIRDMGYTENISPLSDNGLFELYFDTVDNLWYATTTTSEIDGIFSRKIQIEDVYRDAEDKISSTGVSDENTKKVTVYIVWPSVSGETATTSVSSYITNLFNE